MQIPARWSFVSFYRSIFWLRNVTSLTASRLDTIPSQSDPKSATKSYNLNSFVALFVKYICLLKSHRYPTDQTSHLSLSLLLNENWYFAMFEHHPWLWHVTCSSVFTPSVVGVTSSRVCRGPRYPNTLTRWCVGKTRNSRSCAAWNSLVRLQVKDVKVILTTTTQQ